MCIKSYCTTIDQLETNVSLIIVFCQGLFVVDDKDVIKFPIVITTVQCSIIM